MRRIILLFIYFAMLMISSTNAQSSKYVNLKLIGNTKLKIQYGGDLIYGTLPRYSFQRNIDVDGYSFLKIHGDKVIKNKMAQIGENNYKIFYTSVDTSIALINEFGKIEWKNEGSAKFKVSVFDFKTNNEVNNILIEVNLILLPFSTGISADELVEKLGFPDKETSTYWDWTDKSGDFEGIHYYFETDGYGITIKHWTFDKFPNLRIRLGHSETVASVRTQGWHSGYDIFLPKFE